MDKQLSEAVGGSVNIPGIVQEAVEVGGFGDQETVAQVRSDIETVNPAASPVALVTADDAKQVAIGVILILLELFIDSLTGSNQGTHIENNYFITPRINVTFPSPTRKETSTFPDIDDESNVGSDSSRDNPPVVQHDKLDEGLTEA